MWFISDKLLYFSVCLEEFVLRIADRDFSEVTWRETRILHVTTEPKVRLYAIVARNSLHKTSA
jgi:hypothetical protein